jgi:hypothetical protein
MSDALHTDRKIVLGRWRRVLFFTWLAAGIVIAAVLLIGGPMVGPDGASAPAMIAYLPMAATAIFALSGLAWLIAVYVSRR